MLFVDHGHILSASRRCLITDDTRKLAGIRAVLTSRFGHVIYDGERIHYVRKVLFFPSGEWAAAVSRDPVLFEEAERAIQAVNEYPGVEVETWWAINSEIPATLRAAVDGFANRLQV